MPDAVLMFRDADLAEEARSRGHSVLLEPGAGEFEPLPDLPIVCIDKSEARELARRIVERGVPEGRVGWIDDSVATGGVGDMFGALRLREIMDVACIVHDADDELMRLSDVRPEPDSGIFYTPGVNFLERHMRFRANEVVVVAGPYGSGKSTFAQWIGSRLLMGGFADGAEIAAWFNTLEDDPIEQQGQIERLFPEGDDGAEALKRRIMVTRPRWDGARSIEWWEARARYLHHRFGCRLFIVDPWSEMDHATDPRRETETQYVSRVMRSIRAVSQDLRCIVMLVTHVNKSAYPRDGGLVPFRIVNAMGSSHFGGKADRGICVQRAQGLVGGRGDHTVVHFDKIKIEGPGKMGVKGTLALTYAESEHCFFMSTEATKIAEDVYAGRRARGDD